MLTPARQMLVICLQFLQDILRWLSAQRVPRTDGGCGSGSPRGLRYSAHSIAAHAAQIGKCDTPAQRTFL